MVLGCNLELWQNNYFITINCSYCIVCTRLHCNNYVSHPLGYAKLNSTFSLKSHVDRIFTQNLLKDFFQNLLVLIT